MPKRRAARRAAARGGSRALKGKVVLVSLALCLTASGLMWAGWGRSGLSRKAEPYGARPAAATVPAPPPPQSFTPASPAKEYVYAGGRLVATEEPTPAPLLAQTITFAQPPDKTYGDAPFALSATASSNLPVSFSVTSGPATVSGNAVTITGAGAVSVKADQAGGSGYQAAPGVTRTFTVAKATPALTWANPAAVTYGTPLSAAQLNATAPVPGTFTYTPAVGTVLHAGARGLQVTFAPSDTANYNTSSKGVTLTVNKAVLTVTAQDKTRAYGASNPALTYAVAGFVNGDTQAGATTGQPALSTAATAASPVGTYAITAAAGTLAAADYSFSFINGTLTVTKAGQTITFAQPPDRTYGDADFVLSASASSGLAVGFAASGNCTVAGSTVHLTGAGSCTVTASQGGNTNYNVAPNVARTFSVAKAASTTVVTAADASYDGQPHGGTAVVTGAGGLSQGLAVSYSGRNGTAYGPSPTAPTNAGDYTASASYGGGPNHLASSGSKDFRILKAAATLTLSGLSQTYNGSPKVVTVTTSPPGLGTVFITYNGSTGAPTDAGSYAVTATLTHQNYAGSAAGTLVVAKAAATLTLSGLTGRVYNGSPQAVTVTTNPAGLSGVSVTYNGSSAAPTNAGSYAVVATLSHQNYSAAAATGTMAVARATPAVTWPNPADMAEGTPLGPAQLNATANVSGSFAYTPPAGTVLPVGNNQQLSVSFTPADSSNYNTAQATARVNVIACPNEATTVFTADSDLLVAGASVHLNWSASNAASVEVSVACQPGSSQVCHDGKMNLWGSQPASGSLTHAPANTTTYILTAGGAQGCPPVEKRVTVEVVPDPADCSPGAYFGPGNPPPGMIVLEGNAMLTFSVPNATAVTIIDDTGAAYGTFGPSGQVWISTRHTRTYTLSAQIARSASCSPFVLMTTVECSWDCDLGNEGPNDD